MRFTKSFTKVLAMLLSVSIIFSNCPVYSQADYTEVNVGNDINSSETDEREDEFNDNTEGIIYEEKDEFIFQDGSEDIIVSEDAQRVSSLIFSETESANGTVNQFDIEENEFEQANYSDNIEEESEENYVYETETLDNWEFEIINGINAKLTNYIGNDTNIIIPDTVQSSDEEFKIVELEDQMFKGNTEITSVTFGKNLTTLGDSIFQDCTGLTTVNMAPAAALQTTGNSTFMGCSSLTSVTYSDAQTLIGDNAFRNCIALSENSFGSKIATIGEDAFNNCTALKEINLTSTITRIEGGAFYNCNLIEKISFPDSVTEIGYKAFSNCTNLSEISYPINYQKTLSKEGKMGSIFCDCPKLSKVSIPEGVTEIPKYAFYSCASINEIVLPSTLESINPYAFANCTGIRKVEFEGNLKKIDTAAFRGCSSLEEIVFSNSIELIGESAFQNCNKLTNIDIPGSVATLGTYAFADNPSLSSVTFHEGLTRIESYAFAQCSSLKKAALPDSITEMGYQVFGDCESLSSANLPLNYTRSLNKSSNNDLNDNKESKGNLFYNCKNLKTVTIPEGMKEIPPFVFANCDSLETISLPESLEKINRYAFYGCTGLKDVVFSEGLYEIDNYAFYGCSKITNLNLPNSIVVIGKSAFENTVKINNLILPKKLETIGASAFQGMTELETVSFNQKLTTIQSYAFKGNVSLTELSLPISVTDIGYQAFSDCTNLKTFGYPAGYTRSINKSTNNDNYDNEDYKGNIISGCTRLKIIEVPEGTTLIPNYAFANCTEIRTIVLPKTLTVINSGAFLNCTNLQQIWIDDQVTSIETNAFSGDTNLTIYGAAGSYAESFASENGIPFLAETISLDTASLRGKVTDQQGNAISGIEISVYNKTREQLINYYETDENGEWNCNDAMVDCDYIISPFSGVYSFEPKQVKINELKGTEIVPTFIAAKITDFAEESAADKFEYETIIGNQIAVSYVGSDEIVSIPEQIDGYDVTAVKSFGKNKTVKEVYFSKNITNVYANAFEGCSGLENVYFDIRLVTIGAKAFKDCVSLNKIEFPCNLKRIESYAFYNCNKIEKLDFTESIEEIGYQAFGNCKSLSEITYPINYKESLNKVTNNDGYDYQDHKGNIFYNCINLKKIVFPEGVTQIAPFALANCASINEIVLPVSLKTIERYAFYKCTGIQKIEFQGELEYIEKRAFEGCSGLVEVSFPQKVKTIGTGAFKDCTKLTKVVIPDNIETIGMSAFSDDYALKTIVLGDGLKRIESYAFFRCKAIEALILPDSVEEIGYQTFAGCENLSSINLPLHFVRSLNKSTNNDEYDTVDYKGSIFKDCGKLKTVKIPEGMEQIPSFVFANCTNIEKIVLPESMKSINKYAFYNCTGLKEINLPKNITLIDNSAFENVTNLKTIVLPEELLTIGESAFKGMASLESVEFNQKLTTVNKYAFDGDISITELSLPASVTDIGFQAFANCTSMKKFGYPAGYVRNIGSSNSSGQIVYGCTKLRTIVIPEGTTVIPEYAFYKCANIKTIILPTTLTSIKGYSFSNCTELTQIWIDENVTSIDRYAFVNDTNLTIYGVAGSYAETFANTRNIPFIAETISFNTASLSGKITDHNGAALSGIEVSVYDIGKDSVLGIYKTDSNGEWSCNEAIIDSNYCVSPYSGLYEFTPGSVQINNLEADMVIPDFAGTRIADETNESPAEDFTYEILTATKIAVTYTGNQEIVSVPETIDGYEVSEIKSFNSNKTVKTVYIPDTVAEIGQKAFSNCTALEHIYLGIGLEIIGQNAFSNCKKLSSILLPPNLSRIENLSFSHCESLSRVVFSYGVKEIGYQAFSDCLELEEINYPFNYQRNICSYHGDECKQHIGSIFYNCPKLHSMVIPEGVEFIPEYTFENCASINEIIFPSTLKNIEQYAFAACTSINEITLPSSLENIEQYAFSNCSGLRNFELNQGLETIAKCAFYNCVSLNKIVLPDSVEKIGYKAFANCESVSSANLPLALKTLDNEGAIFFNCKELKEITVSEGMEILPKYTFSNCNYIEKIILPTSIKEIEAYAFYSCKRLKEIELPDSVAKIGNAAFKGCSELVEIHIPDSIKVIEASAFYNASSIKELNLPQELETIENYAFYGMAGLEKVNFNEKVKSIGNGAFQANVSLRELSIPPSVTDIGYKAFADCTNLRKFGYPAGYEKSIYVNSVYGINKGNIVSGCTRLYTIEIPEGVKNIPEYAFQNCEFLRYVTIPDSVTSIGNYAFNNCTGISEIVIGKNVEQIGIHAFEDCSGLSVVSFPLSVSEIGNYGFNGCNNLQKILYAGTQEEWDNVSLGTNNEPLGKATYYFSGDGTEYLYELKVPELTAASYQHKQIKISWTNGSNPNYIRYYLIYRSENGKDFKLIKSIAASETEYIDKLNFDGDKKTYYYKLTVCDKYEQKLTTDAVSCEARTNDTIKPNAVISLSGLNYAEIGENLYLSAGLSSDNDGISSYAWDFGDGKTAVGVDVQHKYTSGGTFEITLTVTDKSGNTDKAAASVNVVDLDEGYSRVELNICDSTDLKALSNAQVIMRQGEKDQIINTDAEGIAKFIVPNGECIISVSAHEYLLRNIKLIAKGGVIKQTVGLSKGSIMTGNITVTEMTRDEILEAGIDPDAPDNIHVYKFAAKAKFKVGPKTYEIPYFVIKNNSGEKIGDSGFSKLFISFLSGSGAAGGAGSTGGGFNIKLYPITEHFLLVIYGEAHWLKEMYKVELIVNNNSMTDTLEDVTASLELPDGLSLATMVNGEQSLEKYIGTIGYNSSETATWYIRGDKAGEYNITANVSAISMPYGDVIVQKYTTSDPVKVYAGTGLQIKIICPDVAERGKDYNIKFRLENVSDKSLYDVYFGLSGSEQYKVLGWKDKEGQMAIVSANYGEEWSHKVDELAPGGYIELSVSTTIWFNSALHLVKLTKVGKFVDLAYYLEDISLVTLEGSTTTIPYTIEVERKRDNIIDKVIEDFVENYLKLYNIDLPSQSLGGTLIEILTDKEDIKLPIKGILKLAQGSTNSNLVISVDDGTGTDGSVYNQVIRMNTGSDVNQMVDVLNGTKFSVNSGGISIQGKGLGGTGISVGISNSYGELEQEYKFNLVTTDDSYSAKIKAEKGALTKSYQVNEYSYSEKISKLNQDTLQHYIEDPFCTVESVLQVEIDEQTSNSVSKVSFTTAQLSKIKDSLITNLEITTNKGTLKFDRDTIEQINTDGQDVNITFDYQEISGNYVNDDGTQNLPMYTFTVDNAKGEFSEFNKDVEVKVPYMPRNFNNNIVIKHIKDDGSYEYLIPSYDANTKTLSFATKSFSSFIIIESQKGISENGFVYNTVRFDANEGVINHNSISNGNISVNEISGNKIYTLSVSYNDIYGPLPVAEKEGYDFVGWFTDAVSGNQVSAEDRCTSEGDFILFAHYTKTVSDNSVSSNEHIVTFVKPDGTIISFNAINNETYGDQLEKLTNMYIGEVYDGMILFGWKDNNGNIITKDTIINLTEDITLTPVFHYITLIEKQKADISIFFAETLENCPEKTKIKYVISTMDGSGKGASTSKGVFTAKKAGLVSIKLQVKYPGEKIYTDTDAKELIIAIKKMNLVKQSIYTGQEINMSDIVTFSSGLSDIMNNPNYALEEITFSKQGIIDYDAKSGRLKAVASGSVKIMFRYTTNIGTKQNVLKKSVVITVKQPRFSREIYTSKIGKKFKPTLKNIIKGSEIQYSVDNPEILQFTDSASGKAIVMGQGVANITVKITYKGQTFDYHCKVIAN